MAPFSRLIALVLSFSLVVGHASADQAEPTREAQEQLKRITANLFSPSPQPAVAIDELKALLAKDPALAEAHMLLGIAYRVQGSPDRMSEAVAELRQAVALEPSLLMARLTLARLYLDMARAARAREELESALEQAPGRPEFLSLLGEAERKLGNPRRAVDLNRQALEAVADFMQARYYLGLALLDLRQHADAVRELRLVVESGENPVEANLALGTAYLEAGRVPDALTVLKEAARVAPANPDVHIRLAQAHRSAKALGQADKALAVAEQHVKEGLAAVYSDRETDLLMETGLLRMAQGRLDAAAAAFQRVLTRNPQHPGARQQLGEVRKRLKEKMGKTPGTPS